MTIAITVIVAAITATDGFTIETTAIPADPRAAPATGRNAAAGVNAAVHVPAAVADHHSAESNQNADADCKSKL